MSINSLPNLQVQGDDPEVAKVMMGLRKPVYSVTDIIADGPNGRTKTYEHINSELLCSFVSNGRRFVFAADYARYLVALKRIGEAEGSRHHLAKPKNRPAHDPSSQRVA